MMTDNKEKSLMTTVSKEILSSINFLQSVPYKIHKKSLKEILSQLKKKGFGFSQPENTN